MLLDGIKVASKTKLEIKQDVVKLNNANIFPCLATVLVGNNPASLTYVKNKHNACREVGIHTIDHKLSDAIEEVELINLINKLNNDNKVHGILVQLPLPDHIDQFNVLNHILSDKDVDGLTIKNAGLLLNDKSKIQPCTPKGVMRILDFYGINLEGKNVVVINRSILVGKPLSLLLLEQNATVTICHSKTKNLKDFTTKADIVITAIGNRNVFTLTKDMIKEGSVVIDIGTARHNGRLTGDVDFDNVSKKAAWITPVPGGIGPMTICMLLENTVIAAQSLTLT